MANNTEMVANAFWIAAGGREEFGNPVDIDRAVPRALPAGVVRVPRLDTAYVAQLLARLGADPLPSAGIRGLRGCVIADLGAALILVDSDDPADEQRMTVAHEVAHLLLHYLHPRQQAVRAFGTSIQAVLDRTRPPTPGERFSSAVRDMPIEPYRHAMDREHPGRSQQVAAIEAEADDLAIELLAPNKALRTLRSITPGAIRDRFGLPAPAALRLATLLAPPATAFGVMGLFRN